jgi:hypothetical protein
MWGRDWRRIRRSIGFASLIANIAIVGMLVATAFWEKQDSKALGATVSSTEIHTTSDLDLLNDAH